MRQAILMRRPYRKYKTAQLNRRFYFPLSIKCAAHIGAIPAQWRIKGKPLHASDENPPLPDLDETDRALVAAATTTPPGIPRWRCGCDGQGSTGAGSRESCIDRQATSKRPLSHG